MKTNEILDEIHRVREEIARECDYDVHKLFERMRQRTEKLKAEGWQVVYPEPRQPEAADALREEPPRKNESPGEKRP
ncbi:MAG: hypothetical protein MUF81_16535 [Verrucomicrobia bacterium]|jgi:hypothetical protein|nr:hypothetical protein [Verrucomicrobiota bacterium]